MNVSVNGAELFYSTRGTGYPCLVPAVLGTKLLERLTPPPLTDHFQFIYVDLRGGGRSTGSASDLTFDLLAADLDAVRQALRVDRLAVLGYSIAGALAIEYARRYRSSVSHVIVSGTPPTGDMARVSDVSTRFFEGHASADRKRTLRDNMAKLPPGTPPTQAVFAQTPMRFFNAQADVMPLFKDVEFRPELLGHIMTTLTPAWDVVKIVPTLMTPLLVAHGRHDYVVPYTMWDGLIEKLPAAMIRLFEKSGHQPFFEEPERFAEVVQTWMTLKR